MKSPLVLSILIYAVAATENVPTPSTVKPNCQELRESCHEDCQHFMDFDGCMTNCTRKFNTTKCGRHDFMQSTRRTHPIFPVKRGRPYVLIYRRENEFTHPLATEDGTPLWEGDMILTKEQVQGRYDKARKAESRIEYRWPDAFVPFSISDSSKYDRNVILRAIKHWMSHTCLRFEEVPENSAFPHLIFKKNKGCSSSVGRQFRDFPNGQPISVGTGCEEMGLVAHEIGHAIGFYHEHSRSDRNENIKIAVENIKSQHTKNFNLAKFLDRFNLPYDLDSVMHYTSKAFTNNGKNTVVTLDPWKQLNIGQREKLSYYDIKLANLMYCANKKRHCNNECQNGGFTDANCNCVCFVDFTGKFCQMRKARVCGGNITQPGDIQTPNHPKTYPEDSKCIWWIKAPPKRRVKVTFHEFDLMSRAEQNNICEWDSVEIRAVDIYNGESFCGDEQKGNSITSAEGEMIILFAAEYGKNKGFKASIEFPNEELADY